MINTATSAQILESEHSLDEFTDIEELKSNYVQLKAQRNTYKLLLANYEKIFLHDCYTPRDETGKTIEDIKNPNFLSINGGLMPIIESSTYSSIGKEMKIRSSNPDFILLPPNEEGEEKMEKSKETEVKEEKNISQKIEKLNEEINALKTVLEGKSDLFQFSEKNIMSELNFKKFSSSFPQKSDPEIIAKHKPSIDKCLGKKNSDEEIVREGGISKNIEDLDKSIDSTCQMQNFFNNMTSKLKVLEERNQTLSSQVQTGLKEKEELLNNIGHLQNELAKLNREMEEKNRENYKNQIETFLELQEKNQAQKNNICRNLCNLI